MASVLQHHPALLLKQVVLTFVLCQRVHRCSSGTAHARVTNCCGRIKISDTTMFARLQSVSSK